ncbi:hypothetical protein [Bordetella sp. BOR01]|uniref:hypothetical protein n=1 Tax=Bordetella sp. BOR01 TaxID=2854779 RepID=UPI001C4502C4|nr:hypothetical protein [Bordetella sp. BOR01]MBV7482186.1 hypothetical protein [Bordetella sp. BOR01]
MNNDDTSLPDSDRLGIGPNELWEMAEVAGLTHSIDESTLLAFALAIAESCAEIGDDYNVDGRSCGNAIRTHFGLG